MTSRYHPHVQCQRTALCRVLHTGGSCAREAGVKGMPCGGRLRARLASHLESLAARLARLENALAGNDPEMILRSRSHASRLRYLLLVGRATSLSHPYLASARA